MISPRENVSLSPEHLSIEIESIGGLAATIGVDAQLSERQREALRTAFDLGYYDVPKRATQSDVADAMECAPATAAEHLQKAEATLVRSALDRRP